MTLFAFHSHNTSVIWLLSYFYQRKLLLEYLELSVWNLHNKKVTFSFIFYSFLERYFWYLLLYVWGPNKVSYLAGCQVIFIKYLNFYNFLARHIQLIHSSIHDIFIIYSLPSFSGYKFVVDGGQFRWQGSITFEALALQWNRDFHLSQHLHLLLHYSIGHHRRDHTHNVLWHLAWLDQRRRLLLIHAHSLGTWSQTFVTELSDSFLYVTLWFDSCFMPLLCLHSGKQTCQSNETRRFS